MIHQQSFRTEEEAALYLVPTPIGNLEDMTFRAIRIMEEVDIIFAEDTRQTRKLCSHFEISTDLDSYHEHNKDNKGSKIISLLTEGKKVALVSDAGTPLVSDPGKEIVEQAQQEGISVISLPGANAAVTALTASGFGGGPFYFYGFLPRKKKDREAEINDLSYVKAPLIFYESPHRLKEMVSHLEEKWKNRKVVLAREITKKFEELVRGTIAELKDYLEEQNVKGECCVIVEGADPEEKRPEDSWWEEIDILTHVQLHMEKDMSSKEAIKETAKERGLPKREVYAAFHDLS
ncbi:16S rRNA (cytidine1402-2'-O)-methyltransferase [Salibacterium salarium]|uniref:16S rRNA (cytidine(1402)-2'-O)-methyltransferase n=1 Tax=Salibacterium salarium TaxID=284579 RepID=UPI002787A2FD|nr:16S rRNA (cytidine(1402)-2'-O)-methyltransferase [Salibacterium salarium]MDQ0300940.1 16S rRNA (cytidine1402-2'-O)-methyltransferase [Salibacterium salarium]